MKLKNLIFIGVVLLVSGIVLRIIGCCPVLAVIIIIAGVSSKLSYVITSIINKTYKPGKELLLMYMGLVVFFTGLYFRRHGIPMGIPLEVIGITMKITFIVLFIRIMKKPKA